MGMIRSCTRIFHLTALLLSYHPMNRIPLLAERAGMVIRLMQLWVPRSVRLPGTMGRNRWFCLKVGSCWLFLFLRYNSNFPHGLSLFLGEYCYYPGCWSWGSPLEKEYGFLLRGEITSWSWVLQDLNLYLSLNGLLFPLSD